jgi:methylenetetrahydrofolate reductase (NADPH)
MKLTERLAASTQPRFSFELLPPPKGGRITQIIEIVEALQPFNPAFINVTSHASSMIYMEDKHGQIVRKIHKKRPGTLGVCGVIQNKYGIDAVAHVLCQGFSKEETEDLLIELNYMGVDNVLALKGDNLNYNKDIAAEHSSNQQAIELVSQINQLRQGQFLNDTQYPALDFCVGVAAYPEKHHEAPNHEADLLRLKAKVDAGADYIITQMFFDNAVYFDFVARCRAADIHVPIIPGLKILSNVKQLSTLPKLFHIDIPQALVSQIEAEPHLTAQIGETWALAQTRELITAGVPCVHFFLMNDASRVIRIMQTIQAHT